MLTNHQIKVKFTFDFTVHLGWYSLLNISITWIVIYPAMDKWPSHQACIKWWSVNACENMYDWPLLIGEYIILGAGEPPSQPDSLFKRGVSGTHSGRCWAAQFVRTCLINKSAQVNFLLLTHSSVPKLKLTYFSSIRWMDDPIQDSKKEEEAGEEQKEMKMQTQWGHIEWWGGSDLRSCGSRVKTHYLFTVSATLTVLSRQGGSDSVLPDAT